MRKRYPSPCYLSFSRTENAQRNGRNINCGSSRAPWGCTGDSRRYVVLEKCDRRVGALNAFRRKARTTTSAASSRCPRTDVRRNRRRICPPPSLPGGSRMGPSSSSSEASQTEPKRRQRLLVVTRSFSSRRRCQDMVDERDRYTLPALSREIECSGLKNKLDLWSVTRCSAIHLATHIINCASGTQQHEEPGEQTGVRVRSVLRRRG